MSFALRIPSGPVARWRLALAVAGSLLSLLLILQQPPWVVLGAGSGKLGVDDYVEAYTWIAAAIGIGVLFFLGLICGWWAGAAEPAPAATTTRAPRWFWPLVAAAVLAAAGLSLPLLGQSLEADECMSLRESILGRFRRMPPDGRVEFKEISWTRTVYGYQQVNNHILASILARISNGIWRAAARPAGLQFNEVALRLPFFLAALCAVAAYAMLLRAFGHPEAGVLAAWLIALHPWYERYTSLARGYGLVFLLLAVIVLSWRRGMTDGRWRWWSVFAVCEFLMLWAYPGMLFFLVLLNLLTVVLFVRGKEIAQPVRAVSSRWFCCNALASVGAMPLLLPLFPQVRAYFDSMPRMLVDGRWVADTASLLLTGRWWAAESGTEVAPSVSTVLNGHPLVFWTSVVCLAILLLVGLLRFCRSGSLAVVVATAWLGAPVLQFFYARHEQMFIWVYYVIYALPFAMLLVALGLFPPAAWAVRHRYAAFLLPLAGLGLFAFVTQGTRGWQYSHSATLLRESTLLTRPGLDYLSEENRFILTAGITSAPLSYDANYLLLRSETELAILCMQAERSGRPLFLNQGHFWVLEQRWPKVANMVRDPVLFCEVARMKGETATTDRLVVRYCPGAAGVVDWSRYLSPAQLEFAASKSALEPEQYFVHGRPEAP